VYSLAPGFHAREPRFRRRVGGSSKKGDDHQITYRLAIGKIGVYPKTISGLEMRDLSYRQSNAFALHSNFDLGTNQIESRSLGGDRRL